jgi:predicted nucleotidyltransferase
MPRQPIDFLFSHYRRQVLALLLLRPDERFHVRELERLTGISAGSLHRELKAMAQAGLLVRERQGNQVLYRADRSCSIFEELASIFRKTVGLGSLFSEALSTLGGAIEVAFIFGSMAAGTQTSESDIDICVVGDVSLLEVVKALAKVKDNLGRELNPVVITTEKLKEKAVQQDRFVMRMLSEPKLFLKGDEDEFAKLVTDRAA